MARTVFEIIDGVISELNHLKAALAPLAALGGSSTAKGGDGPFSMPKKPGTATKNAAAPAGTRRPMSPKLRAFRVLQGRYIGAIRNLTATQKAQVKKVQAEKGYEAALKLTAELKK